MAFFRHLIGGAVVTGSLCYGLSQYIHRRTADISSNLQTLSHSLSSLQDLNTSSPYSIPGPDGQDGGRTPLKETMKSRWNEVVIGAVRDVQNYELSRSAGSIRATVMNWTNATASKGDSSSPEEDGFESS
ncbi:hypothetical protein BT69DRAFT_1281026 [Atractiella rhizophila]|nr:hypothetical protein BT69DRAFT_1281026 [Atractiella rhizophila]